VVAVQERMMLPVDCSDLIVRHPWIDNKKTVEQPGLGEEEMFLIEEATNGREAIEPFRKQDPT
jgi:hypothetical protein